MTSALRHWAHLIDVVHRVQDRIDAEFAGRCAWPTCRGQAG